MSDAPYFSFWAKDWLTGEGTRLMTPEQKGAFIDLLSHAWLSSSEPCTLPSDEASLAKLSGLGKRWAKVGGPVLAQFDPTVSGRLRNDRLFRVWTEMEQRHGRRVAAGAKGGKAKAEPKQSSSNATAMLKQPKPKPKAKKELLSPDGESESFPRPVYTFLHAEYVSRFGPVPFARFCAAIKPCLMAPLHFRPGQLARAMGAYAEEMVEAKARGRPKIAKVEYFAEGVVPLVREGDLCAIQIVSDPSVFGLTQAEANEKVAAHQDRLKVQDDALYQRILTGQAAA